MLYKIELCGNIWKYSKIYVNYYTFLQINKLLFNAKENYFYEKIVKRIYVCSNIIIFFN